MTALLHKNCLIILKFLTAIIIVYEAIPDSFIPFADSLQSLCLEFFYVEAGFPAVDATCFYATESSSNRIC